MILLDTHTWVWWVGNPDLLSAPAKAAIDGALERKEAIHVATISTWEVALLVARGRLVLAMDVEAWVAKSEALPFVQFVPLDNAIAQRSVTLPGTLHNDLADRIIVATARTLGATLVTKDQALRDYPHVVTLW